MRESTSHAVVHEDVAIEWRARWIWDAGKPSPRNAWRCFRGTFDVPTGGWDEARVSITADSRYTLYVNGERVGRGPVRTWPSEQRYDAYDVGCLLRRGATNTVAALVQHYGLTTFSYIRGRGGLLAQVDLLHDGTVVGAFGTDASWRTARHLGQDPRAPRLACMLGFTERIDARFWDDEAWPQPGYDDGHWGDAVELGSVGVPPWTSLLPRDIPLLAEAPVWPARVASLHEVERAAYSAWIDVRAAVSPESADHANHLDMVGYLATVLRVPHKAHVLLAFPSALASIFGPCFVGGVRYGPEQLGGTAPERSLRVPLEEGEHLLLIDVTGRDHGRGLHLVLDSDAPFEVASPLGSGGSEYALVGPFHVGEHIDHLPPTGPPPDLGPYADVAPVASREELLAHFGPWVRPIPEALVAPDNTLGLCIYTRRREPRPVPATLQQAVAPSPTPAPVPAYAGADTELVVDFGRELSGFLEFEVDAPQGTVLDLYGYEYERDGWRQHTHDLENTIRYTCREGRQRYSSHVRRGLRYLAITVRAPVGRVRLLGVSMLQSNYPVAEVGEFACSDALLDQIWAISRRTVRLCMEDTFVDCPAYEQTYWVGDARPQALIGYYLFGAEALAARCLRLVPGSRSISPLLVDQAPSGWNSVIPDWTFLWVVACTEHYERTGDKAFARDLWPPVQAALDSYLEHLDGRGLLDVAAWSLLDWGPSENPNEGVVTHQNMLLVAALSSAAALARVVEDFDGADRYERSADVLTGAINRHLWSEGQEAYIDCVYRDGSRSGTFSHHPQFLAYRWGVARGERAERMERLLLAPPPSFVGIATPFQSFFLYEALAKAGRVDALLDDMRESYGGMIRHGATTCWEGYPSHLEWPEEPRHLTRSHCHGWSAAPGYFLPAYVLGVRPAEPGWRSVVVEPQPCGLTWARGGVPLPEEGRIAVAWEVAADGRMSLRVWAPAEIEVHARLPEGYEGIVQRLVG